ncbi:type II toxin-antitoxin system RelE/ParE family toxin [Bacteroides sp. OttesenSCG-928-M17]|nr:type II toxin-antitoxin system RelE/ParE family toxin [Bacteroides sp. OttesenSCG-928-M17]
MSNGYNVEWSELAVNDFNEIIQYLSKHWGENEIRSFVRTINGQIETIRSTPNLYPSTSYRIGLRRCVASKPYYILYCKRENNIYY